MSLHGYCGSYSMQPWTNDSIGLCFLELYVSIPVVLLYLLVTIVYCVLYRLDAAFEAFPCKIFWLRITTVVCILCKGIVFVILGYFLPLTSDAYAANASFEIVHNAVSMFLWLVMLLYDFFQGKTMHYSSRGPLCHLILSLIYFYICVLTTWSAFQQVPNPWRVCAVASRILHLCFVTFHLVTKVPISYNFEEPRRRNARLTRTAPITEVAAVVSGSGDESADSQPLLSGSTPILSVESRNLDSRCRLLGEENASCLSKVFFHWMSHTIIAGYYGELADISKLPPLPIRLNTIDLESKIAADQKLFGNNNGDDSKSSVRNSWPFIKFVSRVFGTEFVFLGFLKFMLSAINLCSPVALNFFILSLSNKDSSYSLSSLWGGLLVSLTFLAALVGAHYDYRMATFGYKIRVSVTSLLYRRILSVRTTSLSGIGTGGLVNYLTADADRIVNLAPSIHEVWAMPLQLLLAIVLLYHQLGVSCLVGVAFLLILLPINRLLASQIGKYSKRLMHFKDARIKLMSETLSSMTAVKLACWEWLMRSRILQSRSEELRALRFQKLLDAGCVFCWAACPALLASCTFVTYVSLGNQLSAPIVFTSLSLFGMLIGPMNAFPWVINGVIEATVSVQRIIHLLRLPSGPFPPEVTALPLNDLRPPTPSRKPTTSIDLHNARFYWSNPEKPVLTNITLCVQKSQLVGVVGPVGSGKSALLLAILGEMNALEPSIEALGGNQLRQRPHYAYVGQTPWLFTGTVRDNIVFGAPHDPLWLSKVVFACALETDIAAFPHGLDTDVGEAGGSRLSGGQRARVALARAVYQKADIYLLDDPLAALDVHVGEHVVKHCLLGLLADRIRVVTSHQTIWLTPEDGHSPADVILELQNGQIVNRFVPRDSQKVSCPIAQMPCTGDVNLLMVAQDGQPDTHEEMPNIPNHVMLLDAEQGSGREVSDLPLLNPQANDSEAVDWESQAFGAIDSYVYWSYFRAVGAFLSIGVLLSLFLMQASRNASDWWLSHWVQVSSSPTYHHQFGLRNVSVVRLDSLFLSQVIRLPQSSVQKIWTYFTPAKNYSSEGFYLSVYGGIVGGHVIATTFRAVLFALGGLAAAATIHEHALDTILQARVSYFDRTPQGRILNRFSADVGTIDDSLPFILNILLANLAGLLGVVIIACISLPFLFFLLLPLVFIFWSVQRTYRGAARDLKRISSVTRSPVYAHFSDTLAGLTVIRGHGQEARFRRLTADLLGRQLQAELASLAAGSWLNIRLQLIATGVVAGVVALALTGRIIGFTQVAAAGLSAAYALNIAGLMTGTVFIATETEKNLIAVERCQELTDDTPMESPTVPTTVTAPVPTHRRRGVRCSTLPAVNSPTRFFLTQWPSGGRVEFVGVSLVYRKLMQRSEQSNVQALKDISFVVHSGERLGIVGRTGSGKSSLLRVLMRLVEHLPGPHTNSHIAAQRGFIGASGNVYVDGVDIRTVPLSVLRSRILSICQEPFLFSGTLRDNLDPEGTIPNTVLHQALFKCQLATTIEEANTWLERNVGEAGRDISAGQRQLICLARALLRQPRPQIICLDEATAAVDSQSEEAIHDVLDREFEGTTLLLIAHRLSSVKRLCSRVLVMDSGQIVAEGDPEQLLANGRIQIESAENTDLIRL
ncbi:Multidrug resistance-associated protein 7 [Clonorchis sinensis]|uniref:ABC-type xenobiotic transporter n=1 Tax=Clonorchis sinensis TaxID=79923 RepID=A0A3R7FAY9_CLOSI|nr:Multidrug resistance-associated protein 7 [Clonorchis sinensis]